MHLSGRHSAQSQGNANPDGFVGEKAELFHRESIKPWPAVWLCSGKQAGKMDLIASLEETVEAFTRSFFVQMALFERRSCGEFQDVLLLDEISEGGEG